MAQISQFKSTLDPIFNEITRFFPVVLAIVTLFAAIWRMFATEESVLKRLDGTTLMFLGVAGALLLIREVKSLGFGDYKVEFDRVQKIAEEAKTKAADAENQAAVAQTRAENAEAVAIGTGRSAFSANRAGNISAREINPGEDPDDPWKGQFGGNLRSNHRELNAKVSPVKGTSGLYTIDLSVSSTDPDNHPLDGTVMFYLHPTFSNDKPVVSVGPNGKAELSLRAWGAFTVGAVTDDGQTSLESDLAQLPGVPKEFASR